MAGMTPLVARVDPKPLSDAILGLYHELENGGDIAACMLWIDLIEHYVKRYTEPLRNEERLSALWSEVTAELGQPWTLDQLAKIAGISGEHLRRLCQQRLGRSPMQQLTYLRVQQAAHLLATTDKRVEDVAFDVGYQNSFAFSNTFKRMTGFRPSRFQRSRKPKQQLPDDA